MKVKNLCRLGICIFIFWGNELFAQSIVSQSRVPIGQSFPNLVLNYVVKDSTEKINTSDLRGRLIIFDYGGISCSSCVAGLPKMDALQQEFGDQIRIFWVTENTPEQLHKFIQTNRIGKTTRIPMVAYDSSLWRGFHNGYYCDIWIDGQGILRAATEQDYIDSAHIAQMLSGQAIYWPVWKRFTYDQKQDLLALNKGNLNEESYPDKIYYSTMEPHLYGVPSFAKTDSSGAQFRIHWINQSILIIYGLAFEFDHYYNEEPVFFDLRVRDSSRIYKTNKDYYADWEQKNEYCYEASFPVGMDKSIRDKKILNDLNFYFGLNGRVEEQTKSCWVLFATAQPHFLKIDTRTDAFVAKQKDFILSVGDLKYELNSTPGRIPFFDDTHLEENKEYDMGIEIKRSDLTNLAPLRKDLAKYGLGIKVEKRKVKLLVITDAK
jgi:thiol-disulfide isomerase/thioredoxin